MRDDEDRDIAEWPDRGAYTAAQLDEAIADLALLGVHVGQGVDDRTAIARKLPDRRTYVMVGQSAYTIPSLRLHALRCAADQLWRTTWHVEDNVLAWAEVDTA